MREGVPNPRRRDSCRFHSRSGRGFDSHVRILKNEAGVWRNAQFLRGKQKCFRVRLAIPIFARAYERIETVKIGFDRYDRIRLKREVEQSGRIASGHAGEDGSFAGQNYVLAARTRRRWPRAFPQDPQPERMLGTSHWHTSGIQKGLSWPEAACAASGKRRGC